VDKISHFGLSTCTPGGGGNITASEILLDEGAKAATEVEEGHPPKVLRSELTLSQKSDESLKVDYIVVFVHLCCFPIIDKFYT
jgi:hypothetical protein